MAPTLALTACSSAVDAVNSVSTESEPIRLYGFSRHEK
jgi:hypothetical protein